MVHTADAIASHRAAAGDEMSSNESFQEKHTLLAVEAVLVHCKLNILVHRMDQTCFAGTLAAAVG